VTITRPCYCTREQVKAALDVAETARADTRVDRAIESASDDVDGLLHRRFWPWTGVRYFAWPDPQQGTPWRLWLNADEAITLTALTADSTPIPASDYFLEPVNAGPPFTHIEINLGTASAFTSGATHQRAIAGTGVFGHSATEAAAGQLAEALDASETAVDVTDSAALGVGDLVRVDDERMLVVGKTMLTTGQTLQTPLTASAANTTVVVSSGAAYAVGETILLDSERMSIEDIAGNNLIVKRAFDGSVLTTHTGSTIYAPRTLTVARGAAGTTAATHSTAAALARHVSPGLVRDLALAYALNQLLQERSGYARVAGQGDNQREFTGRGIKAIEDDAYTRYGRKARSRAV
jgi:hypothetical protein